MSGLPNGRQILDSRRVLVISFFIALLLQTGAMLVSITFLRLPISTGWDNEDYIRTADNVVGIHSFSIEDAPPFSPNGFRTPGPLILNIPLRLLSFKNDIAAAVMSRLVVLAVGLLCMIIAAELSVDRHHALLAGPVLILSPTVFYYSMMFYQTELPYALVCCLLALGTVLYLSKANSIGAVLIGLSALYALYLRPAALFVLIAYISGCVLAAVLTRQGLRRRALIAAVCCLFGAGIAYATWCYRNYVVFGEFEYSTVSGENLLRYNAQAMEPFLDGQGKKELSEYLAKYPIKLQRYSGPDQFVLADQEGKAGLHFILKYPTAFLQSHLRGSLESTLIFYPEALRSPRSILRSVIRRVLVITMSGAHLTYLVLGTLGLALLYPSLNASRRSALLIIVLVGVISVLTGGALRSPRFRIPLDIPFVIGITNCIARVRGTHLD